MKSVLFLAVLSFSGLSFASSGGLFLEPSITYERGDSSINLPSPVDDTSGKIEGFGAGLRLGFHIHEAIFLGLDGRYSLPTFKDSGLDQNVRARSYNYGPVIGIQTPTDIGLRVWGSYILGAEMDPNKDKDVDEKFKKGKGYRIGSGIKLGDASLNLEYQYINYNKTEIQEASVFTGDTSDVKMKNHSWIVSVSFPVTF